MQNTDMIDYIRKARQGDARAFREIVDTYQDFAYRVSFRFVRNAHDAEDIVQEAFVRLWKNLDRYREDVKLSTWLYRILVNLSLDQLKSAHHRSAQRTHDLDQVDDFAGDHSADRPLDQQELQEAIARATGLLTPKQKSVFILRDLEGLSAEEVCSVLSMTADHVKSNLYHARKAVYEKIKAMYQHEKQRP
jgi:RNA polymerase sigma-70 factor (ECF subfamily)